jgi:hypothetical protein
MVIPYRYGIETLWIYRDRDRDWIRRQRGRPNQNQKETLHLRASLNSNPVPAAISQGWGGADKPEGWCQKSPSLMIPAGLSWLSWNGGTTHHLFAGLENVRCQSPMSAGVRKYDVTI